MNWLEFSYGYIFACIRTKKRIFNLQYALHPDAQPLYRFLESHLLDYKKYPTPEHLKQSFNIRAADYEMVGWSLEEIANKVRSEYTKDKTESLTGRIQAILTHSNTINISEVMESIKAYEQDILKTSNSNPKRLSSALSVLKNYRDNKIERVCGFGFPYLDTVTGGIHRSQFTVLFGSVSEGKSTLARKIAGNIAMQGKKVVFITMEEQGEKSIIKTISKMAHFDDRPIYDNKVDLMTAKKARKFLEELKKTGGDIEFVDRVEHRDISTIIQLYEEYKPDVIFLDQMTLFTNTGSTEEKDMTRLSRNLKAFSSTYCPIVALTQEKQFKDKKKTGYNVGYSAAIHQDADIMIFVHNTEANEDQFRKKITLVKNRDRERYIEIDFLWELSKGRIEELEQSIMNQDDIL